MKFTSVYFFLSLLMASSSVAQQFNNIEDMFPLKLSGISDTLRWTGNISVFFSDEDSLYISRVEIRDIVIRDKNGRYLCWTAAKEIEEKCVTQNLFRGCIVKNYIKKMIFLAEYRHDNEEINRVNVNVTFIIIPQD